VSRVEDIVEDECRRYSEWLQGMAATPVVRQLREHFERVRAEEVEKNLRRFNATDRDQVERLTKSLINKLLHLPTTRLKADTASAESRALRLDTVRDLFALGAESGSSENKDAG
jgi:glutamyl-tRNA reductase